MSVKVAFVRSYLAERHQLRPHNCKGHLGWSHFYGMLLLSWFWSVRSLRMRTPEADSFLCQEGTSSRSSGSDSPALGCVNSAVA